MFASKLPSGTRHMRKAAVSRLGTRSYINTANYSLLPLSDFDSKIHDLHWVTSKNRSRYGEDRDMSWALAHAGFQFYGLLFSNPKPKTLCEHLKRGDVIVSKNLSAEVVAGPVASAVVGDKFAITALNGETPVDEVFCDDVRTSLVEDVLPFAPTVFVIEGAIGSTRKSEVRVRLVTDSAAVAAYFRNIIHEIPLYDPQIFPFNLEVVVATAAREGVEATSFSPAYVTSDVEPGVNWARIDAVGNVKLESIENAIGTTIAQFAANGDYRSVVGGSVSTQLRQIIAADSMHWYYKDKYAYAAEGEPHPELTVVKASAIVSGNDLVLVAGDNDGAVAAAAAAKSALFSSKYSIIQDDGVSAFYSGLVASSKAVKNAKLPSVAGTFITPDTTTTSYERPGQFAVLPTRIIHIGKEKVDISIPIAGVDVAARINERLGKAKVEMVASADAAIKALGL